MSDRYSSRVFVALNALHARLLESPWPPHPITGSEVEVVFGDQPQDSAEVVGVVVSDLGVDTQIEWRRLSPPGADEDVFLDVVARSMIVNQTSQEAMDRLETLAEVAQAATYDTAAKQVRTLNFDGEACDNRVTAVRPEILPIAGGWGGVVVVSFRIRAHI